MSLWDDISDRLGEISFDDVLGVFDANDGVSNQAQSVREQQAAQPERFAQPVHGQTASGQPILAGQGQMPMMWYQDPFKLGAAVVGSGLLIFLAVKAAS